MKTVRLRRKMNNVIAQKYHAMYSSLKIGPIEAKGQFYSQTLVIHE
jgi:hypothetical protein